MLYGPLTAWRLIRRARSSSRWPADRLRTHQETLLRELLRDAWNNVPLYRKLYDGAEFDPSSFRTLDDLHRIPPLPKPLLKAAPLQEAVARGTDPSKCHVVATSGSTGIPLKIYLGPFEQEWQRAAAWRILFEHGYRLTDRSLEIRMNCGEPHWLQKLGIARKDWLSILSAPSTWAQHLAKHRNQVIIASATTLTALAEAVESAELKIAPVKLIISDSETLPPRTRQIVRRALGVEPVDVFGLVEASNFAWECEQHRGYHVSADSHIVEIDAAPGQIGQLLVTDLGMRTMPIIRYETGDMAEAPQPGARCPCGRTLPLIPHIYGRAIDSVVLRDGRRLFWPFFHEILGERDDLSQWRVTQTSPDRIVLQICGSGSDPALSARIAAAVREKLPFDLQVDMEQVERFEDAPNEKIRPVTSLLPGAQSEVA